MGFCRGSNVQDQMSRIKSRGSRVKSRGLKVKIRESRIKGRGSRVKSRDSRVKSRGSRAKSRGSQKKLENLKVRVQFNKGVDLSFPKANFMFFVACCCHSKLENAHTTGGYRNMFMCECLQ